MKIQAIKSYTYANIGTNNRNNPPEINSKPDNISKSPSEMPRIGRSSIIYFTSNINFGEQNKNPQKKFDLNGKTILITGGTGTIGNYLINSLFENYSPKKVIVYSRDELKQHVMKQKNRENQKLEYIIGDVRDEKALQRAFRNVDAVIHTAAMKHVPFCEENPEEAVKTNIDGARNIINASEMVNYLRGQFPHITFNLKQMQSINDLSDSKMLVNSTPIGMRGKAMGTSPIDEPVLKTLPADSAVYDIVYNPLKTELLRLAQKNGYQTITGLDMFVHQGAKAFEIWTGKQAKPEIMKIAVLEHLVD